MLKIEYFNGSNYEVVEYEHDIDGIIDLEKRKSEVYNKACKTMRYVNAFNEDGDAYIMGPNKTLLFSGKVIQHNV